MQNKYSLNQGYFPFTFVYQAEWPDEIMAFFSGVILPTLLVLHHGNENVLQHSIKFADRCFF